MAVHLLCAGFAIEPVLHHCITKEKIDEIVFCALGQTYFGASRLVAAAVRVEVNVTHFVVERKPALKK